MPEATTALFFLWRPWLSGRCGWAMDAAVLALALCLGMLGDVLPTRPAWPRWGLATCAGVALFAAAVWATATDWKGYFRRRVRVRASRRVACFRVALLAPIHEEWVWRVAFQSLLSMTVGQWAAVTLTGVMFTVWHRRAITHVWAGVELLAFSWVLGACYALCHDVIAVILIHGLRNFFAFSVLEPEA